jgi:phosphatidylglycerol:prolipoprotein diacylglycerol transferase
MKEFCMLPLVHLGFGISIPTYYLVISLVTCVCLFWLHLRQKNSTLSRNTALDLSLILMITGFIGARLFHVFFESWEYYQEDPMRILYFWDGGFVFFGGAMSACFFGWIFLRWKEPKNILRYFDFFSPVLSLAYSLGRTGCLMAGCCYGKFCDLPWSVSGRHPTQIYASLWELGVVFILLGIESIKPEHRKPSFLKPKGSIFFIWIILHSIGRLMMESFRDDFRGPVWGLSISSWLSWGIIFLGVLFLATSKKTKQ